LAVKLFRFSLIGGAVLAAAIAATVAGAVNTSPNSAARTHHYGSKHHGINCSWSAAMCTEVSPEIARRVFGHYVGHDEPSVLFDSNTPGSGNRVSYNITLPKDPSASNPTMKGKSYQFELSGADWFGMAICDSQSYPEQVSKCPRDTNNNILDPATAPNHVGEAYLEMQFYPPGWIPWPTWQVAVGASTCSPTQWCAALNIDSLGLNPVTNQLNNSSCLNTVGEETVNFAFITKNGKSTGPANPVDATTSGTYTPSASKDLFMNSGDHVNLKMFDTKNGLMVVIHDLTTGKSGSMTASKSNGFGQVVFNPAGTSCQVRPYDFHPMYRTSSPKTRVTWAAGAYNVAMDTEIGHFQTCTGPHSIPATQFGLVSGAPTTCPAGNQEETGTEASDGDDLFCFPASEALRYKVAGCTYTNTGFDGFSYQPLWPDGNTKLHPTPFQFTSPTTGKKFSEQYKQAAISVDLPDIESQSGNQACNRTTASGCTHIPITDDGFPATFYPWYSITRTSLGCVWQMGNTMPHSITDFGKDSEYGPYYAQSYTTVGGGSVSRYNDFLKMLRGNPCPQK
jgi:hypothetical protein